MRYAAIQTVAMAAGTATAALVLGVEVVDFALRHAPGRRILGRLYSATAPKTD